MFKLMIFHQLTYACVFSTNTLPLPVNYEMNIFDKENNLKSVT